MSANWGRIYYLEYDQDCPWSRFNSNILSHVLRKS
jgi:hypothetical protein